MVCKGASHGSHVVFSANNNDVSAEFACELLHQIKAVELVFSHTSFKAVAPSYFIYTWRGCRGKHPLLILELFLSFKRMSGGIQMCMFFICQKGGRTCVLVPFSMGCASFPGAVRLENLTQILNQSSYIWHMKCCATSYTDLYRASVWLCWEKVYLRMHWWWFILIPLTARCSFCKTVVVAASEIWSPNCLSGQEDGTISSEAFWKTVHWNRR